MKPLAVVLLALILAGCATQSPHPKSSQSLKPVLTGAAKIDAAEAAGVTPPPCYGFVGKQETDVFDSKGSPFCITGSSVSADKTTHSIMNCDPVANKSTVIYGWGSDDPLAPDQNTYAAKVGGVVVIVPNAASSKELFGGVIVADYIGAVGCP